MVDYKTFSFGNFPLESGTVLHDAKLAYETYGKLNSRKNNAILLCSYIAGTHQGYELLIKKGRCFDPSKYFVIATNMFANGLSSSPSNTPQRQNGPYFPHVAIRDNVRAQYMLLTEGLKIKRLKMVSGYSMGAQQTFQ